MKACVIIPCYNHVETVAAVAREARVHCPVIIVDDGSTLPLPDLPGCTLLKLGRNQGKAAALRVGFRHALEEGFTHAVTMDADGQHFVSDLPRFLAATANNPEALILGVRDFLTAGCPTHRRRSNAISTFWYRVATGLSLSDTQCGFRAYPLALTRSLRIRSGRYAYELEFLVRAAWCGTTILPLPVKCTYAPDQLRQSHFRPLRDFAHITLANVGLVLQSWCVPQTVRRAWSRGEQKSFRFVLREFFAEHAESPNRLAAAVGVGLFFGIAPIWGYQLVTAIAVAHFFNLNKAITALASNISIPPMIPFILYGALALGHWLFTGQGLEFAPSQMTRAKALEYLWQWAVGSVALATVVALCGASITYLLARTRHRK